MYSGSHDTLAVDVTTGIRDRPLLLKLHGLKDSN